MRIIINLLDSMSPQRSIFLYYLGALIVSTLLMQLPFFYNEGTYISFMDTLFVTASGISVTGLTTVNIVDTFNTYGIILLMFILNLGGIGIMATSTFIWILLGRKITLRNRAAIMVDNNQSAIAGGVKLVLNIVSLLFLIELIGAIIYTSVFYYLTGSFKDALLQGTFLSVSATTNAGFDLYHQSLIGHSTNFFLTVPVMFQIVLGAIGYPVLIEVKEFFSHKNPHFRFSLFTKVTTTMYALLYVIGTVFYLIIEWNGPRFQDSFITKMTNASFMSVSSRSAGIVIEDPSLLNEATQLVLSMLMFIGSSPSSAGGGIRTTTFAILLLTVIAFARSKEYPTIFKRTIAKQDVERAFVVFVMSMVLLFLGISVITFVEGDKHSLMSIIFEVSSAFGTCGMSMGITNDLQTSSELILIALMFIGRVGFVSFLLSFGSKKKTIIKYPTEHLTVG
ncbi:TrkH family potassium uptake protein [Nosocomiicoccus sp. HMSC09A07]|uniref:TrkH family potassium uptake protein n=1 Tax=Nosocomiicoccus sp. HMSC09A07 TaxID=1581145 RepID=UPI0008B18DD6|nr:potassium transporter TrkG [Nosocomiicoccus sp. HMSC09A07]OFS62721.1 Trk family potassium uptake protein [Nosocomiicoccus sp. HMSC09A07]